MNTQSIIYGILGLIVGSLLTGYVVINQKTSSESNPITTENHQMHSTSMSMQDMTNSLKGKVGDDFDKAFISAMIEHHQGAIDMANEAKVNAQHEEIKNMADEIISAQTREIEQMKQWSKEWGYQ